MSCKFTALLINGMLNNEKLNPVAQFALLLVFTVTGLMMFWAITNVVASYVLHIKLNELPAAILKPENTEVSRLVNVFSSILIWGVPAFAVAIISGKDPAGQLGCNEILSGKQTFFVVLMIVAAVILTGALAELNHMIPVPEKAAMKFQQWEDQYNKNVMGIANMKTTNDYIFSLMVLALVPALFEELFFRGVLQQTMIGITKNAFAGIFITSFIFSAIHGSFYGFLPRLFLGLMLGYIFYYSKNLWLSIIAHFLNNAFGVTVLYNLSRSGKLTPEAMEESYPLYYGLIGAAAIVLLFIAFRKESKRLLLYAGQKL
jgi:uncharacterized protein